MQYRHGCIPLLLFISAAGRAQERVTVPDHNSSRPRHVNITLLNGAVTVKAYSGKEVTVETSGSRSGHDRHRGPAEMDGLKRLDLPGSTGLEVEEENNTISIRNRYGIPGDVIVTVPVDTWLMIRCTNGGSIVVEGVHGEVDVQNLNGRIFLSGISGTVVAHSQNGAILASLDRVDPAKPISFSTMNGAVDVTLPADFRANLRLKADNGEVYSDFDIKLNSSRNNLITEPANSTEGRYRVKADRNIYGTVNGGGPDASFTTFNGRISIRKKK